MTDMKALRPSLHPVLHATVRRMHAYTHTEMHLQSARRRRADLACWSGSPQATDEVTAHAACVSEFLGGGTSAPLRVHGRWCWVWGGAPSAVLLIGDLIRRRRAQGVCFMLRFPADAAFEAWLQSCPLDPRRLSYSATRCDGQLTLQCTWRLPAAATGHEEVADHETAPAAPAVPAAPAIPAAPASAAAATAAAAPPGDDDASETEAERLKASLLRMQAITGASDASPATLLSAMQQAASSASQEGGGRAGGEGMNAQAALAAAMLAKRRVDADGRPAIPSREEIRMVMGMGGGLAFPKAPGSSASSAGLHAPSKGAESDMAAAHPSPSG